jgi:hypothetical protein
MTLLLLRPADFLGGSDGISSLWVPMLIVGHLIVITLLRQLKRDGLSLRA